VGQDQDLDAGQALVGRDLPGRGQAVELRHPDVHQHHISALLLGQPDRLPAGRRLADHSQVGRAVDHHPPPGPHQFLVVREQHPGRGQTAWGQTAWGAPAAPPLSRRQRRTLGTQPGPAGGPEPTAAGAWVRWADTVQWRPAVLAAVAVAVMLVLAIPLSRLQLGSSDQGHDPASTTTRQAYDLLAQGFGPRFNGPLVLVAQASSSAAAAALHALEARLPQLADVASVTADAAASGTTVIQLTPRTSPEASATTALIITLRTTTIPAAEQGTTLRVYVGGQSATSADFTSAVEAKLPWFLLTIIGLSFLLLVVAFRSLLIPVTAAVMNLLAAAATFGVMTALFRWGWGIGAFGLGTAGPVARPIRTTGLTGCQTFCMASLSLVG
jgi:uncharacterized membrane protein YdfJ with MMPL/SSD domain